ncbi:hypothetical protein IE81DRAFT_341410 [Ceraceosorus guamensis]|uniref:RGS domain-containing protein n=1 Tax=Ceraceosorus guamensis TaxID=1522189 RepID=A0A316W4G9_9BASI|nr:hypothetical protein IE81DRAFT_341410 [Ceraceosorus guamensis]PWN42525.1 hypothetical protein IE81DRAFT_341410 [Ceraceosorus guamensis]
MDTSSAGPSQLRRPTCSPHSTPKMVTAPHLPADDGRDADASRSEEPSVSTSHNGTPAPWVFDQQPAASERGCTFSPQGELLIGGLGIDGRNTRTGESGWASLAHTPRHAFGVWKRMQSAAYLGKHPPVDEESVSVSGEASFSHSKHASRPSVLVEDIVEGRTCQPISLSDFRKFLVRRRREEAQSSAPLSYEADFSMLGGGLAEEKKHSTSSAIVGPDTTFVFDDSIAGKSNSTRRTTLPPSSSHGTDASFSSAKEPEISGYVRHSLAARHVHSKSTGDALDALDFVVAVDRYATTFARLSSSQRELAPACEARTFPPCGNAASENVEEDQRGACVPEDQPLRKRLNLITSTYIGGKRSSAYDAAPKLAWMRDTGLLSETALAQAIDCASRTTHPDAILPLARAVQAHLDSHVLPSFLDSASHNLSRNTKWGRLVTGIACTIIALLLSVLLIIEPSPLSPHYATDRERAHLSRWWRFLTLPLWAAGIGSTLAAYTGVCVWLSLRGNHEPEKVLTEEAKADRPAHIIAASINGDHEKSRHEEAPAQEWEEAEGHTATPQGWLMAPELKALLLRCVGRHPSKTSTDADKVKARALLPRVSSDLASSGLPTEPSPIYLPGSPEGPTAPLAEPRSLSVMARSPSTELGSSPTALSRSFRLPGTQVSVGFQNARTAFAAPSSLPPTSSNNRISTSTIVQMPDDKHPSTVPALRSSPSNPMQKAVAALQQWTGFAINTKPVLDERVRKIHQRAAINALALCTALTLVAIIIVLALP